MTVSFRPAPAPLALAGQADEAPPSLPWQHRCFARGERIPCEDGLHILREGLAAVRKRGNSGPVLLSLAGPGCVVTGQEAGAEVEALADTTALFLPEQIVSHLIGGDAAFTRWYVNHLRGQLGRARSRIYQLTALPARARLAWFLLEQHHTWDGDGYVIRLPLNRRELAAALGIRPETLARLIRTFDDAGVASFDGPVVKLPSLAALETEVGRRVREAR